MLMLPAIHIEDRLLWALYILEALTLFSGINRYVPKKRLFLLISIKIKKIKAETVKNLTPV